MTAVLEWLHDRALWIVGILGALLGVGIGVFGANRQRARAADANAAATRAALRDEANAVLADVKRDQLAAAEHERINAEIAAKVGNPKPTVGDMMKAHDELLAEMRKRGIR